MRKLTSILLVAGIAAMIVSGCRSVPDTDTKVDSKRSRAKSGAASGRGMDVRAARTQEKPERIKFSEQHDAEIREVLRLASDGEWESAETMVARLANE
ncbi:MAG: hypothetical protein ACI8V5_003244, partial [Limisphaerales bacterium]